MIGFESIDVVDMGPTADDEASATTTLETLAGSPPLFGRHRQGGDESELGGVGTSSAISLHHQDERM